MVRAKENIGILFLFTAFFSLLFIKFPLNGSLIGDLDIWFYVWYANDYYQILFDNANYTQINFPIEDVYKYTDSVFGLMSLYIPFRFLTSDDIWIFYLLIVVVLSLNAFSLKLLFENFGINKLVAICLALIFNCNNFLISNIENFSFIILFPCFFAALFLSKGLRQRNYFYIFLSALFVFYQQSFSIYIYVFGFFLFALILFRNKFEFRLTVFWLISILILTLPFFIYHNESPTYLLQEPFKSASILANEYHSIYYFKDLARIHFGNLIYPNMNDIINPWRYGARSAFFGFSSYLLFIISLVYFIRNKKLKEVKSIIILLCITLFIASGPIFRFFHLEVLNPIGWINMAFPKTAMLRHLFRIHIFNIFFVFLLIGLFLNYLKSYKWVIILFSGIFILENFPFNYSISDSYKYINPPKSLVNITEKLPQKSKLFFLPSCLILDGENELARENNLYKIEAIYAVWENNIHHHIYNGVLAQIPDRIRENYQLSCNLNDANFKELIETNDIDYFVLSKVFMQEKDILIEEVLNEYCNKVDSNQDFELFQIK